MSGGLNRSQTAAKLGLSAAMAIFGTVGLFRRLIPLPSAFLAMTRGVLGAAFLLVLTLLRKQKPDFGRIRKNLPLLLLSGGMIGVNWILLFEAYNHTTVAAATLCYYMEPTFLLLVSPFALREALTLRKGLCAGAAFIGMLLVSGVFSAEKAPGSAAGILLALGAAALYTGVVVLNKKLGDVAPADKTVIQLASAAAVVLPYTLAAERVEPGAFSIRTALLLLLVGAVHTGAAYALYFAAVPVLPAGTTALFSYIDPVTAVVLSVLVLKEPASPAVWIGAALILGAAILGETRGDDAKIKETRKK